MVVQLFFQKEVCVLFGLQHHINSQNFLSISVLLTLTRSNQTTTLFRYPASVLEGSSARLSCSVTTVLWSVSGVTWWYSPPDLNGPLQSVAVSKGPVLNFEKITSEQSGNYSCVVESEGGRVLSYPVTINVFGKW